MNLKLHYNIASTYSQKVLLALFEKGVPFTPAVVNLQDPAARAEYKKLYPIGKIPLLTGEAIFIPESSIIIEFLENEFPDSGTKLIPDDKTAARRGFHAATALGLGDADAGHEGGDRKDGEDGFDRLHGLSISVVVFQASAFLRQGETTAVPGRGQGPFALPFCLFALRAGLRMEGRNRGSAARLAGK